MIIFLLILSLLMAWTVIYVLIHKIKKVTFGCIDRNRERLTKLEEQSNATYMELYGEITDIKRQIKRTNQKLMEAQQKEN